jgi:acetoin utilization protein AcuC
MYEAAALHVGGTLLACDLAVHDGRAFNLGGGFHHAMRERASGFCIFNDPAIGIRHLLDRHDLKRVLYVDTDAHHADGVEVAFYDDPRVLTISFHESGATLFPGTGWVEEIGAGEGRGYSVNVPLPPHTFDEAYLSAFDAIVPPLADAFRPQALVTQFGADAFAGDPLANLLLTPRAYEGIAARHQEMSRALGIPWVAMTGGGYLAEACARVWTLLYAAMCGKPLARDLPQSWRDQAGGGQAPSLGPGLYGACVDLAGEERRAVARAVAKVVADVKRGVFPIHGLAAGSA